jgi:hypothetical protein
MYFASGLEKALGVQWWNGEAVWIALHQDQFSQINVDWMASVPWVPRLLCWGTLVIETLFPFGIFWAKTKKDGKMKSHKKTRKSTTTQSNGDSTTTTTETRSDHMQH